jgi:hypothetical protein
MGIERAYFAVHPFDLLPGCKSRGALCGAGGTVQVFLSKEGGSILEFRVIWQIDIHADSPKEAAEAARAEQRRETSATVFDVWEHAEKRMHCIDVAGCPDRLDRKELKVIRARLRWLQCVPGVPASVRYLASAMLIFLDRENSDRRERV